MKEGQQIEFQKWEGTGNTFVMIDSRDGAFPELENEVVQRICDEEETDGLIVVRPAKNPAADLMCDFRNPDGSRSFCGNGTRATYAYARREGCVGEEAVLEAYDGLHRVRWNYERDLPSVEFEAVGKPEMAGTDWFVDTGSPHHVFYVGSVEELKSVEIEKVGAEIRYSERYKPGGGSNVSALSRTEDGGVVALRTYERGVERETEACGTGAVAAALIDFTANGGEMKRKVEMPGGDLYVAFKKASDGFKEVWLSGKASEMKKGVITFLLALLPFFTAGIAQTHNNIPFYLTLSEEAEVSVLTASPGDDLYALFGHSAIRIHDPRQFPHGDVVYNFGTFSFNQKGFYVNFVRGRLNYRLSEEPFGHFQKVYLKTGRGLNSQTLNLSHEQVVEVAKYLHYNFRDYPEYQYQFFRDNCATRILTVLDSTLGDQIKINCEPDGRTFRDGLKPYLKSSPFAEFGIDFILGPDADKVMEGCQQAYIPDDLKKVLKGMEINGEALAQPTFMLLNAPEGWMNETSYSLLGLNAVEILCILLVLLVLFVRIVLGDSNLFTVVVVKTIQVVLATLGVLLLLMWLFTDHTDTWANWNLVWTMSALYALVPKNKKLVPLVVLAVFIIIAPLVCIQYISLSLWLVALSVFLTITPKFK